MIFLENLVGQSLLNLFPSMRDCFSFSVFRSERHINCRRDYCQLQNQEPFPENLFKTLNAQGDQRKVDLLAEYLDFQEMFSIGVLNGGIAKKFAYEGYNLIVAQDWEYLRNFIFEMRVNNKEPDLYSNFEKLAKKWNK